MTLTDTIFHATGRWMFEMPARTKTLPQLVAALQANGDDLRARLSALSDNPQNCRVLSHIIGIERWAQRRLRVALGEPVMLDEYDRYRPGREVDWGSLKQMFEATRGDSLRLAHDLQQMGIAVEMGIPHNQWGMFSVRGWLHYVTLHTRFESMKLR